MQKDFSKRTERGLAPNYLEYDYHAFTVKNESENLNPFKNLIFKDLLFEQFFPTKPGTQVQL